MFAPRLPRPGLVGIGIESEEVPVSKEVVNLSPMPWIAPPPFGTETDGIDGSGEDVEPSLDDLLSVELCDVVVAVAVAVVAVVVWVWPFEMLC